MMGPAVGTIPQPGGGRCLVIILYLPTCVIAPIGIYCWCLGSRTQLRAATRRLIASPPQQIDPPGACRPWVLASVGGGAWEVPRLIRFLHGHHATGYKTNNKHPRLEGDHLGWGIYWWHWRCKALNCHRTPLRRKNDSCAHCYTLMQLCFVKLPTPEVCKDPLSLED